MTIARFFELCSLWASSQDGTKHGRGISRCLGRPEMTYFQPWAKQPYSQTSWQRVYLCTRILHQVEYARNVTRQWLVHKATRIMSNYWIRSAKRGLTLTLRVSFTEKWQWYLGSHFKIFTWETHDDERNIHAQGKRGRPALKLSTSPICSLTWLHNAVHVGSWEDFVLFG